MLRAIFIAAAAAVATAKCPDYSSYSQTPHAPFSGGVYNLSSMRPEPACRTFVSQEVEDTIAAMKDVVKDPDMYRLFENAFPNSLDTAVKWRGFAGNDTARGEELCFLITGDINVCFTLPFRDVEGG